MLFDHLVDDPGAIVRVTHVPLVHGRLSAVGFECVRELGGPQGVGREAGGDDRAAPGQAA